MDIRIQAIHFDATEQLKAFIQKKLDKLNRFADDIQGAEVVLKVVKPEISNNKEASIKLKVNGPDFFVDKTADSFEEAIDNCIDVLKRKLEKHKEAEAVPSQPRYTRAPSRAYLLGASFYPRMRGESPLDTLVSPLEEASRPLGGDRQ